MTNTYLRIAGVAALLCVLGSLIGGTAYLTSTPYGGQSRTGYSMRFNREGAWRFDAQPIVLTACGRAGTPSTSTIVGRVIKVGPFQFVHWY